MRHPDPRNGTRVLVWPTHGRVPVGEMAGAVFLPVEGRTVEWSRWWSQRRRDGDITLSDPNPKPAPKSAPKAV